MKAVAARALRRACLGLALAGLAGCAAVEAPEPAGFRDRTAPMGATTRFDAGRFAGEWHVVAQFAPGPGGVVTYAVDPGDGTVLEWAGAGAPVSYGVAAPGVLQPLEPAGAEPLVVMWVDEGFRTAAIGTASGGRGAILDRQPAAAPDRLAAAIEVLDFYGWETGKLQGVGK